MSQKVNPKSLRANRWNATGQAFFAESAQYADTLARAWGYYSLLDKTLMTNFKHRILKAPSKRRLKKSAFSLSNISIRPFYTQWKVCPILVTFPRKGFAQKYFPIAVVQKKRFSFINRRA